MSLHDGQLDTLRLLRKLASYEAHESGMSSVQDFDTTGHVSWQNWRTSQKTQLVKVPWHRATDIITACKVFIGSFLGRLPALTRFSNNWRLLDLHHSCVKFGLVCFEYFSILRKNGFVFELLLCHVFNEVEDSGRVTHDSGPS
jgi:hypothetical protein